MDRWDIALAAFAGFVAITSLTRLMLHRRNEVVRQLREQLAARRAAKAAANEAADRDAA
jgi:hypothetical protein